MSTTQTESPSGAVVSKKLQATLVGGNVVANTTAVLSAPCVGASVGNLISVSPASALQTGLGIVGARCAATDTIALTFMNTTAADIVASNYVLDVVITKL